MAAPRLFDVVHLCGPEECLRAFQESTGAKPGVDVSLQRLASRLGDVWLRAAPSVDALCAEFNLLQGDDGKFTWEVLVGVRTVEWGLEIEKTAEALERALAGEEDEESENEEERRQAEVARALHLGSEPRLGSTPIVNAGSTIGARAMAFPHLF